MKGRLIADRYRLVRELGAGAMGSVWLGEHVDENTQVAVKLINAEAARNPSTRKRFHREAKIVALLDSPHVVKVFDHGITEDDQSYIVMEVLSGESLRERLDARGRLPPAQTAKIVSHVCRAMAEAHEAGLVHRDLKPDNVFITQAGQGEVVKVLDFGVAKATDLMAGDGMDPTRTGALLGTPFYMSPEQAQGKKTLDYRSDLWSLGVMVFECLTGTRPFKGSSLGPLVAQIVLGSIPAPSSLVPSNASPEIDEWLEKALAREPEQRFSSATELAESFMIAAGTFDSMDWPGRSSSPASPMVSGGDDQPTMTDTGTVIVDPSAPSDEGDSDEVALAATALLSPDEGLGVRTVELPAEAPPQAGPAEPRGSTGPVPAGPTGQAVRRRPRKDQPPVGLVIALAVFIIVVALAWAMTR